MVNIKKSLNATTFFSPSFSEGKFAHFFFLLRLILVRRECGLSVKVEFSAFFYFYFLLLIDFSLSLSVFLISVCTSKSSEP